MDNFEKIIEQQSRLSEELKQMYEESIARIEELDKVYEAFVSAIEHNLIKWEKDIEDGKITDNNIIAQIKAERETFNTMMRKKESK